MRNNKECNCAQCCIKYTATEQRFSSWNYAISNYCAYKKYKIKNKGSKVGRALFLEQRKVVKNCLEKRQRKNLRKNKSSNNYNCNNQSNCKLNDKCKNLIEPGLTARNRAKNLIQRSDDGIKKFAGHPYKLHSKKNIKRTE